MLRTTLVLSLIIGTLAAQNVFVDATRGNDSNPGTPTLPVRSITVGIAKAGASSTVYVYAGTYGPVATGEVLPIGIGTLVGHAGLTLRGIGQPVFDCNGAGGAAIQVGPLANGARITNFVFKNMGSTDWYARVIEAGRYRGNGSASPFEIDRCVFDAVNRGIVIWENTPPVTSWSIHNNLFTSLSNDAINDFFAGSANLIFNNTIVGTPHLGMTTDGAGTRILNNLITGCRIGIGVAASQSASNFVANDLFNNSIAWQGIGVPPGNFAVDPIFANPGLKDWRLQPTSPLIDAGSTLVPARADLDANPGAVDSNLDNSVVPDVGCYELDPVGLSASYGSGTLTVKIYGSGTFPLGVVAFSLDDGLVQIPSWSPILLDLNTLLPVTYAAPFPFVFMVNNLALPPGLSLVMQGVAWSPSLYAPVPTNQVWIQL